jgi:hypothetical protein
LQGENVPRYLDIDGRKGGGDEDGSRQGLCEPGERRRGRVNPMALLMILCYDG